MPNNYIPQPIRIHEVRAHQHFRINPETCKPYENPYVRTGTALALPNILIRRLTSGAAFGATLFTLEDVNAGALSNPGFAIQQVDDPVNAYEMAIFDRGNWTLPADTPDGWYYILFNSGFFQWWSDEIYITAAGTTAGYPPACDTHDWMKLRWRENKCIYNQESLVYEDDKVVQRVDIVAYPAGMDFFCFLKAGSLIESDWEPVETEGPETGNSTKKIDQRRMDFRWNLQGAPVSEAIIHSMKASAFFDIVEIYFPGLTDPLYTGTDILVEPASQDGGCLYGYSYTFTAGYLLKQGCC